MGEIQYFGDAVDHHDLEERLREQVQVEVAGILEAVADCDAFDIIELLRLRELPLVPVLGLEPGYDGSGAVVELVSLVLLSREGRAASGMDRADTQPHKAVPQLHDRAKRLIRLATFKHFTAASMRDDDPLNRLASEYQSHLVAVRGMQYESIQREHDCALFDRPEVDVILLARMGFTYSDYAAVREAIQTRYSRRLTELRDYTADILTAAEAEQREPTNDELTEFRRAIVAMMFLPGDRASFSSRDIASDCTVEMARIEAVLDVFSTEFNGTLDATNLVVDFLRGVNPLARTCLIRDDRRRYVMTGSQIGADSFRRVIEDALKQDGRSWKKYDRLRAAVSESLVIGELAAALQTPPLCSNFEYMAPREGVDPAALGRDCTELRAVANQAEADALFVIDDVAFCVEVKARAIADQARRGDHVRLRREVGEVLGAGAGQARRLESLLLANRGLWLPDGTWLDLSRVREVRSIVVGLDSFGPLAIALGDLGRSNILIDGSIPWLTSLHDLAVIGRTIDRPAELLLYLRRRTDSGVATHFRGLDELDLFMLFMEGGLYVEPDPDETRKRHPTAPPATTLERTRHRDDSRPTRIGTYTDPLDAWMYWLEGSSPDEVPKPTFNAHPAVLKLVDFLADGRKPGWLRFGADLLGIEGHSQKKLADGIRELLRRTRADGQGHTLTQGYAGMWGYPTIFAATMPRTSGRVDSLGELRRYMAAKNYQVRSDRSLGLLLDAEGSIVHVDYLNDLPTKSADLDAIVAASGLAPVGSSIRPVPPSAHRRTRRLRR